MDVIHFPKADWKIPRIGQYVYIIDGAKNIARLKVYMKGKTSFILKNRITYEESNYYEKEYWDYNNKWFTSLKDAKSFITEKYTVDEDDYFEFEKATDNYWYTYQLRR